MPSSSHRKVVGDQQDFLSITNGFSGTGYHEVPDKSGDPKGVEACDQGHNFIVHSSGRCLPLATQPLPPHPHSRRYLTVDGHLTIRQSTSTLLSHLETAKWTKREGHRSLSGVAYSRRAGNNGARCETAGRRLVAVVAIAAEVFLSNAGLGA